MLCVEWCHENKVMFSLWWNVATDFQQWVSAWTLCTWYGCCYDFNVKKKKNPLQFCKISLWIDKKKNTSMRESTFSHKMFFQIKVSITCFMSSRFQIAHSAGQWKRLCYTRREESWTVSAVRPCDCLPPAMRAHLCLFLAHLASHCTASVRDRQPATVSSQTCSQNPLKASLHSLVLTSFFF